MNDTHKEQIRLESLQIAFGQVLSSQHPDDKLDVILDAMADHDQDILDENGVMVCELYENDDMPIIASRIDELAIIVNSAVTRGFEMGLAAPIDLLIAHESSDETKALMRFKCK